MVKDKCYCLICSASVSLPRKGNLERHYNARHSNKYVADFPSKSEFRKLKLKERLSNLSLEEGTPDIILC
jgi:hypothetical protein